METKQTDPPAVADFYRRIDQLSELPMAKRELLKHYATGEVRDYHQIDCFVGIEPGSDYVMHSDEDSDCLMGGTSQELRHMGEWLPVRVHILQGTEPATASRLLRKALAWVENGGLALGDLPFDDTLPDELLEAQSQANLK